MVHLAALAQGAGNGCVLTTRSQRHWHSLKIQRRGASPCGSRLLIALRNMRAPNWGQKSSAPLPLRGICDHPCPFQRGVALHMHLRPDAQWLNILPTLPIPARALLRERRDLSDNLAHALQAYGAHDYALPDLREPPVRSDGAEMEHKGAAHAAREEMERGSDPANAVLAQHDDLLNQMGTPPPELVRKFQLIADANGRIIRVSGAPSAAMIGMDISRMAEIGSGGVDGLAAGAFRARAGYRDAHFFVPGRGPGAGDWLLSAVPRFSEGTGRFIGYLGSCRRPQRADRLRARPKMRQPVPVLPDG